MENIKTVFYTKLVTAEEHKASNTSSLLSRNEYEQILNRLDELEHTSIKKTQKDYRLLRKYGILEVTVEGITVKKLLKKGTQLIFVCAEDVFDVIDAVHRASRHGGRTIVFQKTNEKYANISRSQIKLYLQFCEECQLKNRTVRKSVNVKPIVSNIINPRAQTTTTINPETRIDDTPKESVQPTEDRSGSEFSHHNSDEPPIPVSPEHFLSEGNDQDDPIPVPPTSNQQHKPESYQLRHNNHLTIVLEALARDESFMDVTLTAQGRSLKAHKSVLSAVSSYFRGVLRDNPCQHPIIIMPRDVRFEELYSIVNYIYKGEMTVAAEDLTSLLKTAEILQVSGLAPSDSSATVNPQTDPLTMGNVRSSSNSSSSVSSSSNIPPVSRGSKTIKIPSQSLSTPPARPKSIESMINPADFIDVDMTCVKEEVVSEGEEEKGEPPSKKQCTQPTQCSQPSDVTQQTTPCSQPPQCSHPTGTEAKDDDVTSNVILGFPSPDEQTFEQPIPSTSSHEAEFRSLGVKSDPEKGYNSHTAKPTDNPQPLQCPHCDEQYCDVESIDSHLRMKHPTKPSFTCKCGRIFTRQIHHQAHTRMCPHSS